MDEFAFERWKKDVDLLMANELDAPEDCFGLIDHFDDEPLMMWLWWSGVEPLQAAGFFAWRLIRDGWTY